MCSQYDYCPELNRHFLQNTFLLERETSRQSMGIQIHWKYLTAFIANNKFKLSSGK
jgi:hypothetical protein